MTTLGFALALISALGFVFFDVSRKALAVNHRIFAILFWIFLGHTVLFGAWALHGGRPANITEVYWLTLGALILMQVLSNALFIRALTLADFSLMIPLLSFTPVFASLFGWLVLSETLNAQQVLGIGIVCFGALTLSWQRAITTLREKGSLLSSSYGTGAVLMLITALIWSMVPVVDKLALQHVNLALHGFFQTAGVAACYLLLSRLQFSRAELMAPIRERAMMSLAILASFLALGFGFAAILEIQVGFYETIKRVVGLGGAVILGYFMFRETIQRSQVVGIVLMATGVSLILL